MPPPPLVTILIDNFNYGRFLARAIESALAQTWRDVEVVVVDDASTDDSREVIARFAGRVLPVLRPSNGGQGAAFNAGIRASHGEIVLLLDADDYLYPEAATRVVAAFGPGVAHVQYRLDFEDADGDRIDLYPPPDVRFDSGDVVPLVLATGRYQTTVTSGNAFTRATLQRITPIPEPDFRISADGYLVTVAPFHGEVRSIEEPLGAYCQHGTNAWATASATLPSAAALAERMRHELAHERSRLGALEAAARAAGRLVAPGAELRDPRHVEARLASLRLDPARHPHPMDGRAALTLRGVSASRTAPGSYPRRLVLGSWFLAVGLLPRSFAARAVAWRFVPSSRPPAVQRGLRVLRRVLRWRASGCAARHR
jgi:hypothetical protein